MKYILITTAILSIFLFGGCVSQSTYETLQKENESLKYKIEQQQLDNGNLEKELNLYKDIPYGSLASFATAPVGGSFKRVSVVDGFSFVSKNPYIVLISPLSAYHNAIRHGADPSWAVATYLGGGSIVTGKAYLERWSPMQDSSFGEVK